MVFIEWVASLFRSTKLLLRKQKSSRTEPYQEGDRLTTVAPPGDPAPSEGAADMEELLSQYLPENISKGNDKKV